MCTTIQDDGMHVHVKHPTAALVQVSYIDLIQTHDIEFGDLEQVSSTLHSPLWMAPLKRQKDLA